MSEFGPPEKVLVENGWYDGPRSGIGLINNQLHRFESNFDDLEDEWAYTFRIIPIDKETTNLEIEQWKIFVDWNDLYEQGLSTTDNHPAHGGVNERYDQIEELLREKRDIPMNAQQAEAEYVPLDRDKRYDYDGPDYHLRWKLH